MRSTPAQLFVLFACCVLYATGCGDDAQEGQATEADANDAATDATEAPADVPEADLPPQDEDTPTPPQDTPTPPEDTPTPPEDTPTPPEDTPKPPEDTPKPPDCDALAAEAVAQAGVLNSCVAADDCGAVKTTICGLCTTPVNASGDATALETAATQWEETCGSAAPDDCCQGPVPASWGCQGGKCVGCAYTCNIDCQCKKDPNGCDLPECEDDQCGGIEASIEALLPAMSGCNSAGDCSLFEYPICGSAGCFQRAVNKDADFEALSALASQGQNAGCSGFTCGCGYGSMPVCLNAQCTLCPGPNCAPSCAALLETIKAEAALAKDCTKDTDCVLLDSPICAEPGLGCYAVSVALETPIQKNINALLTLYADLSCPTADCDCDEPVASCAAGKCVSWQP